MSSFNRVILMGNLTRDVELKNTPSGTAVADMGLAVNRSWFDKNAQEKKEEVTFVDVVLWGRQAEVAAEYLAKGRAVLIEGYLKQESWEDKEGNKRSKLKVVAEGMNFVGSPASSEAKPAAGTKKKAAVKKPSKATTDEPIDDEVPF